MFSDSARQILLWLYRIGAIEALIFEQFGIYLREKYGENSPEYRQKLLHFRYYAVTRSIFVLPYHELFSHGQLDTYFNQNKAIAPEPSLVVNLLAEILAYTPWKIYFESDLSVPNLPNLKAVYVTNRPNLAEAYLSLAPANGRIENVFLLP